MKEDHYAEWYAENEDKLKEDFLLSFTHQELSEYILEEPCDFFEVYEGSFLDFCNERYDQYCYEVKE